MTPTLNMGKHEQHFICKCSLQKQIQTKLLYTLKKTIAGKHEHVNLKKYTQTITHFFWETEGNYISVVIYDM